MKTKDPAGAVRTSSPSLKRSSPARTYTDSILTPCTCNGGPSPGGSDFQSRQRAVRLLTADDEGHVAAEWAAKPLPFSRANSQPTGFVRHRPTITSAVSE